MNRASSFERPPYSLPPIQRPINRTELAANSRCRCRFGLGVNEETGRLQWCPGFTCCKFIIILPVIMLPLTLILILIMRMDVICMALRHQQQQMSFEDNHQHQVMFEQQKRQDQQELNFIKDFTGIGPDALNDMVSEQLLLPLRSRGLSDEERLKRCLSFKFGLSEGIDVEDRDIMKDARTSFLPRDSTALPRECLQNINYGSHISIVDDYKSAREYLRQRLRRASKNNYRYYRSLKPEEARKFDDMPDPIFADDSDDILENVAGFQSFWNEQGTRETIRQAQAKTMLKYMDPTANPCDDFYKYACGNWEKLHPIPKDKAGFDTFEMLREDLDMVLKELLESSDFETHPHPKKKITTIKDNTFEKIENAENAKRVVETLTAFANSAPETNAAKDSRIVQLRTIDTRAKATNNIPARGTQPEQQYEKAEDIRRHVVQRRSGLSRVLNRFERETTNTKRKHQLIPPLHNHKFVPLTVTEKDIRSNSAQRKAKHLYKSCINSRLLAKRGIQPLLNLIDSFGGWPVLNPNWNEQQFDWLNITAHLRRYNNDILIVEWVGPDIKNSNENVIQFDQSSLGLPTREYFLQDINLKYLQAYQEFMSEVMRKLGASADVAKRTAANLIVFETQLASITSPAEQRLNVTKLYKRMTLRQLHHTVPQINWLRYLEIVQERIVRDDEEVVIYAVDYMKELVDLLKNTKPQTVSNYLLWRFVRHRINNVDDRFEDIKQDFYHALFGREESPSRWKVCVSQVNTNMGMAVGSMFVAKYFDENSKRDTLNMTHELQQAFREILKTTDWLDPDTKYLAELKVNDMSLKIGYPDFILNPPELNEKYSGITIDPDKYFENTLNVLLHTAKVEQSKLHEPVNKTTWQTAPAIVNAYYSRNKNQIMFPAGILQPPFYHRHFPRSLNFGGIGVVIGHELTHGFDDKGRLFDKDGNIHKWWSDSSIRGFDDRARCIIAQYSNYTVGEIGIALNGESTQGENIADNGGIRQAFHAYKRWLRNNPHMVNDERLPGINMSGEQLFFLNFGQVWCGAMRPEAVRNKLNTAIHSPGKFRVIGTLSNSKDFAHEFQCPLGSQMNPEHKCSVW